jgi:6-pyruvoyl-tetrahydropterin synthase
LHGHNYEATVSVVGPVDRDTGMVVDYAVLTETIGTWIRNNWDHRHLGLFDLYTRSALDDPAPAPFAPAVFDGEPTAENLAAYLVDLARELMPLETVLAVTVRETGDTSAVVS